MRFDLALVVFTLFTAATARAIGPFHSARTGIESPPVEHEVYKRKGGGGGGKGGGSSRGKGGKRKHYNIMPPRDEQA